MRHMREKWALLLGLLCFTWSFWALSQPGKPPKRTHTGTKKGLTKRVKPRSPAPTFRLTPVGIKKTIWRRCESCHTTGSWKTIKQNASFDHTMTGFPLHGRHKQARCTRCHSGSSKKTKGGRPSHFASGGKTIRACKSCHRSPHQQTVSSNCQNCHNTLRWKKHRLFARHQRTLFPLTGAHASTPCKNCHVNKEQQGWRKLSTQCGSCHYKDYARATNPNHLTSGFSRKCTNCHATYTWKPARINHNLFWPLLGAHQTTACVKCHVNNRYKGTPRDCIGCHQKDYTRAGHSSSGGFSNQCLTCHTQNAWKPATFANHKFPIKSGNHAGLNCVQCHTTPNTYQTFSCLAPCHTKSRMDQEHRGENGYAYESRKCYSCHPQGVAD